MRRQARAKGQPDPLINPALSLTGSKRALRAEIDALLIQVLERLESGGGRARQPR